MALLLLPARSLLLLPFACSDHSNARASVLILQLFRVRYICSDHFDHAGRPVSLSVEGHAPLGELLGMRSKSATGGNETDSLNAFQSSILLDLIVGLRSPQEGAVILPPHLRFGSVPTEPVFMLEKTLLENLTCA